MTAGRIDSLDDFIDYVIDYIIDRVRHHGTPDCNQ